MITFFYLHSLQKTRKVRTYSFIYLAGSVVTLIGEIAKNMLGIILGNWSEISENHIFGAPGRRNFELQARNFCHENIKIWVFFKKRPIFPDKRRARLIEISGSMLQHPRISCNKKKFARARPHRATRAPRCEKLRFSKISIF